jgi:hypothetical protein
VNAVTLPVIVVVVPGPLEAGCEAFLAMLHASYGILRLGLGLGPGLGLRLNGLKQVSQVFTFELDADRMNHHPFNDIQGSQKSWQ